MKKFYSPNYIALFTSLFVFIIYLFTMAPSVMHIDSGELAAVQATLGIAHPTGYPLFTMLGYIFLLLPLPFSKIYSANLLAAIWCAGGVFFFIKTAYLIIDLQIENRTTKKSTSKKNKKKDKTVSTPVIAEVSELIKILTAVSAGLLLAFNKTYWIQSTSVEVYSLHVLLLNIFLFLTIRFFFTDKNENATKALLIIALVLGFGFANHMTTLLVIPALAFIYFKHFRFGKETFSNLLKMLGLFFPILIGLYSYLPLRAMMNPIYNWGNPIDFERFFRHFSGKQYQVWLFSSAEKAKENIANFFVNLPGEFAVVGLVFIIIGLVVTFQKQRTLFYYIAILFSFTVLYSSNYDIVDLDSYYLTAFIALALFSVKGFVHVYSFLKNKIPSYAIAIILLFPLLQGYNNFTKVDVSDNFIFEDYTKAVLNSVEKDALIFSYQWDYFISASYYYQSVENYRPDVAVIDKELLRRSWYFDQLENSYPRVMDGIEKETDLFIEALLPFERSEQFNAGRLEQLYQQLMTNLISSNFEERSIYIAPELYENEIRNGQFKLPLGYSLVPHHFMFKVVRNNEYVDSKLPEFDLRFPEQSNYYTDFIKRITSSMLSNRAVYELNHGHKEKAKMYKDKILQLFPDYRLPTTLSTL